jgi:hypothetical protein
MRELRFRMLPVTNSGDNAFCVTDFLVTRRTVTPSP